MTNMNNDNKVLELQQIEQSLQNLLSKRENLNNQLREVDEALKNLKNSDENYKIVGNIMVKRDKEDLIKELNDKKESIIVKIKNIEKHEDLLKKRSNEIQQQLLKDLKNKG